MTHMLRFYLTVNLCWSAGRSEAEPLHVRMSRGRSAETEVEDDFYKTYLYP